MEVFKFKNFNIKQDNSAMKVGTDGVLLGCWSSLDDCKKKILDIGTGTGVISLIIAQRIERIIQDFNITAVEIDPIAYEEAKFNFENSPWRDHFTPINSSLQDYLLKGNSKYDLIVSNPPFFNNSLHSPSNNRNLARHTDTLDYSTIINAATLLLQKKGVLSIILPSQQARSFISEAVSYPSLQLLRECKVYTNSHNNGPKRHLIELIKEEEDIITYTSEDLFIHSNGLYTEEYLKLVKDFYTF